METYKALVIRENDNAFTRNIESLPFDRLPVNDLLVRVKFSSLNYKDALSASGNRGITRHYPHTPGIDAAGIVESSVDPRFRQGEKVIITGYDLGMNTPGGFGEYVRVPGEWAVPLPDSLTLKESMIIGTAGFTAAGGTLKIVNGGIKPSDGPVVVTGATGGVGSLAVTLLSALGYSVTAVTGKREHHTYLRNLGADTVISREEMTDRSGKGLLSGQWAAAMDTVGGDMLDTILRQTQPAGIVACCGNIQGGKLQTSIYPFILRGISLMGVASAICLMPERLEIWRRLSSDWKPEMPPELYRVISLEEVAAEIDRILQGQQTGRVVVSLPDE